MAEPDMTVTYILFGFLAIWTLIVIFTIFMFYQSASTLPIRSRGLSITFLLTITQWLIVLSLTVTTYLGEKLPCALRLWIPGLLFPLWAATLLARFLRILFLHRINQFRLNLSLPFSEFKDFMDPSMIANPKLANMDPILNGDPDYFKLGQPHSSLTFRSEVSNNIGLNLTKSMTNSSKSLSELDCWLHRNRGWFGSQGLALSLLGFWFFNIVITLLLHITSSNSFGAKANNINTDTQGGMCPNEWAVYPSLGIAALMLMLEWPMFFTLFKQMKETFGIRIELITNLILAPTFLTIYVVEIVIGPDHLTITDNALSSILIVLICFMHLLSVGYPLWWARHEFVLFSKLKLINRSRKVQRQQLLNQVRGPSRDSSIPSIRGVLENPILFMDFKMFTAHNFCVENVLFYERYKNLNLRLKYKEGLRNMNSCSGLDDGDAASMGVIIGDSFSYHNEMVTSCNQNSFPMDDLAPSTGHSTTKTLIEPILISNTEPGYPTLSKSKLSIDPLMKSHSFVVPKSSIDHSKSSATFSDRSSVPDLTPSPPSIYTMSTKPSKATELNCATPQTPEQEEVVNIYKDFIAQDSPLQINLIGSTKKKIIDKLKQGELCSEIFDEAYNEVYNMLLQDIFPRYLSSIESNPRSNLHC